MGQVMDTETRADKSLQQFTMERYKIITKYRTAYHTFQMPVSLALYMVIVISRANFQRGIYVIVNPSIRNKTH
jgi:farnesyl diphosphate synthase